MEWTRDTFTISDQRDKVDLGIVAQLLSETYWGTARPRHVVEKLVETSLCFSLYSTTQQIGFARVVTDFTVFSWLSDLVIAPGFRGRGLGQWLSECILAHPDLKKTQFVLQTTTAHTFYERLEFSSSRKLMTRLPDPPQQSMD
jgi:GNAT superfamily N-acetyltransferase